MSVLKTIAVAGSLAVLTLGMSALPAAATAEAVGSAPQSAQECLAYLNSQGYATTPARTDACNSLVHAFCIEILEDSQVASAHAAIACDLARGRDSLANRSRTPAS
ncbi:hypothetical protein E1292_25780 [Nonomuraea deserti]|uniref:Uncharacterized protein n=1 Tax=Nonomuraea deserti TaxID=1848322 RepID=A0A4R4V9W9_9ACTN|nr:hypothetical protein [Nonomuraea deserti]TDD01511.1 hypothetical protein E1292_25780 [Nonomuraea deserti]